MMKTILICVYLAVTTACASQKEITPVLEDVETEMSSEDGMLVGIVRVSDRGCPFFLDVYENGKMVTMYPVNLEDRYKIDGVKIKFTYAPSRAMQPEKCMVDKVVALIEVIPLR